MRLTYLLIFVCCVNIAFGQKSKSNTRSFDVSISNPLNRSRESVWVFISNSELRKVKGFNPESFIVMIDGKEIPSQYNSKDPKSPGICFVIDQIGASETKTAKVNYTPGEAIKKEYPKRTQAELSYKSGGEWKNREYIGGNFHNTEYLRVPPEHKDHSWFIRYEGPGWESDKVAYRFYLDQRNATDVFGKVTPDMALQKVGHDNFDSYHEMQPWGMDVMKVGKSLGLGSIGYLSNGTAMRVEKTDSVNCRIVENGATYSSILTNYKGWNIGAAKTDLASVISIHAGTRLTHQQLTLSQTIPNICTGIVKDQNGKLISSKGDASKFGYIATWGTQSLNNDELGLVVFFPSSRLTEFTQDEFSHIAVLNAADKNVDYYFAAAWVKEKDGITTQAAFEKFVNDTAEELANPVRVTVNSKAKSK